MLEQIARWCAAHPDQLAISVLSMLAVHLVAGEGGRWARWGCLAGFIAQPLWFRLGLASGVYVICAMSTVYGFSYAKGLAREWGAAWRRDGRGG